MSWPQAAHHWASRNSQAICSTHATYAKPHRMVTGAHRVPPMGMSGRWRSAVSACISLETTFKLISHRRYISGMLHDACMSSFKRRAVEAV